MATYSRSQTTTQNTQTSTVQPSMDISSLLVKTMENVMSDKDEEEESENELEGLITNAINNSDLLKDKNKDNDKELLDLLKDKNNTNEKSYKESGKDKDNSNSGKLVNSGLLGLTTSNLLRDNTKTNDNNGLSNLLKNNVKTNNSVLSNTSIKDVSNLLRDKDKEDKTEKNKDKNTVKSKSDNIAGKIVSGGIIASTLSGIMNSKGLLGGVKGATSGALTGTGKVAGGLISKAGDIGGGTIAGIGKLFGPVGSIVGKAVGTAVAVPFKVVGGTITAAIGGLGKLINMPLKELVTKGTLIAGVLSQLFVFLEGLMAKFIAEKDVKWIDFMSKLQSSVSMIPDKLMLSLEKLLSKVKIMGHPLFGGLSKEEQKEFDKLSKDKTVVDYGNLTEVDIPEKQKQLNKLQKEMQLSYQHATGGELDFSKYNLNTTTGKEALKNDWLSQLPENERTAMAETIDSQLSDYSYMSSSIDDAQKRANYLANNDPKVKRLLELQNKSGKTDEYFAEQEAKLEEKQQQRQEDYFVQGVYDYSKDNDGLTEYQQNQIESLHKGSLAKVQGMYASNNEILTTKDATGAERFLQNQYKQWTDSWSKLFKDFKQDIGINISQKQDIPNPLIQ